MSKTKKYYEDNFRCLSFMEAISDAQGEVLYQCLSWSIKCGVLKPADEAIATEMWRQLHEALKEEGGE